MKANTRPKDPRWAKTNLRTGIPLWMLSTTNLINLHLKGLRWRAWTDWVPAKSICQTILRVQIWTLRQIRIWRLRNNRSLDWAFSTQINWWASTTQAWPETRSALITWDRKSYNNNSSHKESYRNRGVILAIPNLRPSSLTKIRKINSRWKLLKDEESNRQKRDKN